jgi:serine/threonine protein kinase/tetratricopeptide (TPR) repeat protein
VLPDDQDQIIDGRFRLESERIAGGMGMVYRGTDLSTGETVAVKISSSSGSQLGERFQQEANCLATIAHPAIVRYVAHGRTSRGEHYLAMEWLQGETLEDRLSRGGIPLGASVQMVRRVAEALSVAHQHGVIHRDIKPANIFLPDKDTSKIKLLDFGIARRLFDPPSLRLTQAGSALGTPMYMSPEQAKGSLDVDARTDVFSLGCIFFECLTGSPPFVAESTTGALARVAGDEDLDVEARCASVPKSLTSLLRRMLAKRPDERPQSMTEVLDALGRLTGELKSTGVFTATPKERSTSRVASLLVATGERRLVSIIVVSPRTSAAPPPPLDPNATLTDLGNLLARNLSDAEADQERMNALSRDIGVFGAQLHHLANRSLVVTLVGEAQTTPLDLAMRAARCALKLKMARPDSTVGISLGHAVREVELQTADLVNRAVRLLSTQHLGSIHVEPEIKRLLDARFEIVVEPDGRSRLLFEKGLREVPRTVLGREVPCLGREREVRELEGFFEACSEESECQVVVMSGSAGCGKSRVAHEFLERLRDSGQNFELLVGRGDPMRTNVSLGLLSQALRGVAGITGTEPDEVQRKRLFAHASRFLPTQSAPTTVAFLGEIASVRFPDQDLPQLQAARRDARLMADQTNAAWMDWLEAEAEHHPVFILLEDLHWCDFASINYMDSALRILPKKPVMLLALARPEVDERFFGLWRDRRVQRMSLGPLGRRAAEDMIRRVLGEVAPDKIAWLLDHSQGNPFYLEELCRSLALGGDVSAIPDTVLGTVQVRFDAVGEGCKLVLRAASIFGQSFLAAGVKALVDEISDEDIDRWLEILVDKEILFTRPLGSSRQHVFRHALLHQAAYAMLTPKDQVAGHHLAADFLERSGEREAIVLADHYEKGQQPQHAIRWLRVAANQAMEVDDLGAALARVERGVKLGATGDDLAELRVVESEARFWKGEYVEAERAAREGRDCADPRLALRATTALVDALGPQAKYEEIARTAERLQERPAQPDLLNAWLGCRYDTASFLAAGGDTETRAFAIELLQSCHEQLDALLAARLDSMKAHVAWADGRQGEAIGLWQRATENFERAGHRRAAAETLGNVGVGLMGIGQLDEAEAQIRKLLATAERMGLDHMLGGALYALSNILAYRGAHDESRELAHRAIDCTTKNGDRYFLIYTRLYASLNEHLAGNFSAAEENAQIALQMVEDNRSLRPFALALLARALLGQNRLGDAMSLSEVAYCELQERGKVQDGEAIICLAFAECLSAVPNVTRAREVLRKAVEQLQRRAEGLSVAEWRASFLDRIPEHRSLIELAAVSTAGK